MTDRFGYWAEGQAYRTPQAEPVSPPICKSCGARHLGATINCNLLNDHQEPEDDDASD